MKMRLQLNRKKAETTLMLDRVLQLQRQQKNLKKKQTKLQRISDDDMLQRRRKGKKKRTVWVRKWIKRRPKLGQYKTLMNELKREDVKGFRNFLRMDPDLYYEILQRIEGRITKKGCNLRKPLSPGLKLGITLRHLASGDNYHSLMYGFRVAHNTISLLIPQVCEAIIAEFYDEVVRVPSTTDEWKVISKLFSDRWQFHHCMGALDGKHVAIRCPKGGGSIYYNYKGFHSIILMALVDADYKFSWADVGCSGSAGDAQIFNDCELKEAILADTIGFPEAEPLPYDDVDL